MKILRDLPSQPLVVNTGKFTGRSPKDRYFVKTNANEKIIDWGSRNNEISEATFNILHQQLKSYLIENINFEFIGNVISDSQYSYGINLLTEEKWYTQFAKNIFRNDNFKKLDSIIKIFHAPTFKSTQFADLKNDNFVIIHPEKKIILIAGTGYAGEIKKSVFSLLSIELVIKKILPMHCSANYSDKNGTTLYFGLSGTGKTTLSADSSKKLIGDDEHGWSSSGVFNIEGGCYAKISGLKKNKEQVIFKATHHETSIIENVVIDKNKIINFQDTSITENTRSCYSLDVLENVYSKESSPPHPINIIMLTCDAFGVLPPVSKLSIRQAIYHFISGYTAKIPGTESDIIEPVATFSPCFGGPFMPLHINNYTDLLKEKLETYQSQCWLVNTGWWGGPYGIGKRIDLELTRKILNKCINDSFDIDHYINSDYFDLSFPSFLESEKITSLNPINKWLDKKKYIIASYKLNRLFQKNFLNLSKSLKKGQYL